MKNASTELGLGAGKAEVMVGILLAGGQVLQVSDQDGEGRHLRKKSSSGCFFLVLSQAV